MGIFNSSGKTENNTSRGGVSFRKWADAMRENVLFRGWYYLDSGELSFTYERGLPNIFLYGRIGEFFSYLNSLMPEESRETSAGILNPVDIVGRVLQKGVCVARMTLIIDDTPVPAVLTFSLVDSDASFRPHDGRERMYMTCSRLEYDFDLGIYKSYARDFSIKDYSMSGSMLHEIRNAVHSLAGNLELYLASGNLGSEISSDYEKRTRVALEHLKQQTRSFENLFNGGGAAEKKRMLSLKEYAERINALVEYRARQKHITITFDVENESSYEAFLVEETKLNQILINIITNSVKYSGPGTTIEVELRQCDSDYNEILLFASITDHGVGMDTETKNRIFELGYRSSERSAPGLGVGMHVTAELVEQLGGTISIDSELNVGSCVRVSLPLAASNNYFKSVKKEQKAVSLEGRRVLIVDDEDANVELLESMLERCGASYEDAYDGFEALEIYEESDPWSFDVIIADINMTAMSGSELLLRVRGSRRKDSTIPIIAATGDSILPDAYFETVLKKPFTYEDLVMAMQKALAASHGEKDAE